MNRKVLVPLLASLLTSDATAAAGDFDVFERTIPELQAAMERGEATSEELVRQYMARIAAFDEGGPRLNAMIYINPRAAREAAALDRERAERGPRGPLHGIPIVLKDNYDTHDMPTTASAVAMAGFIPPDDGFQVRKLREAGVVFIGKTNMHEFARGIETISSLGGQTLNPYDPRRNPGGSSGGTAAAVAASFAAVGMGSDTCGSIRIPAANNNLYGLRVTQGLSSRDGIIPLSHTQDVAGPLARSMVDLVTVLDATVGVDPIDERTLALTVPIPDTYHNFLQADALQGVRLGLLTQYMDDSSPYGEVSKVVRDAVSIMTAGGAEIVDIEIDGLAELLRNTSVISMEFKADLEEYLQTSKAPIRTLSQLLESGLYHAALEQRYRRSLEAAAKSDEYQDRLFRRGELARLLFESMTVHGVDALVYPTLRVKPRFIGESQYGSMCRIAAHSGLPAISLPAGFTPDGVPVGVELMARPFDEPRLIGLGYAYEIAASPRRPPARTPSLVNGDLVYEFELDSQSLEGNLRLERPTQILHYEVRVADVDDGEILDVKLHRSSAGSDGPVIALLGRHLKGSVAISNADLDDLVAGRLYLVVHSRGARYGTKRGRIERRCNRLVTNVLVS